MAEVPPQTVLLTRLAKSLAGEKASATFACGGAIVSKLTDDEKTIAPENPILFYEDKNGQCHKITFPGTPEEMEKLSSDCDPASFGVGTEERLDTEYRSAWKLDNTKFATSFHPFDSDMMEVVKQLLFSGAINLGWLEPIIVAELYKLNVLSRWEWGLTSRFTRVLMTSLNLMSILHALKLNSDRWSFVSPPHTREENWRSVTTVVKSNSTGAKIPLPSNGQPSTVIANTKSCLSQRDTELLSHTTSITTPMVIKSPRRPIGNDPHSRFSRFSLKFFNPRISCLMVRPPPQTGP